MVTNITKPGAPMAGEARTEAGGQAAATSGPHASALGFHPSSELSEEALWSFILCFYLQSLTIFFFFGVFLCIPHRTVFFSVLQSQCHLLKCLDSGVWYVLQGSVVIRTVAQIGRAGSRFWAGCGAHSWENICPRRLGLQPFWTYEDS